MRFEHPSQPHRIICLNDMVHLVKRVRNNAFGSSPLFFAPSPATTDLLFQYNAVTNSAQREAFWSVNSSRIYLKLWEDLFDIQKNQQIRCARITRASIELTSRSKMSFPLARSVLSQRVAYAFECMGSVFIS